MDSPGGTLGTAELAGLGPAPAAERDPLGRSDAALLADALRNERCAPELLPHAADLVARVEQQIDFAEERLAALREGDDPDAEVLLAVHAAELARARYALRAYLRCRLRKLEAGVLHALDDGAAAARLSPGEARHAAGYFALVGAHLREAVARHLPDAFGSLVRQAATNPHKDMVPRPAVERHVYVRARAPCALDAGAGAGGAGGVIDLARGDIMIVRYRTAAAALEAGQVELL